MIGLTLVAALQATALAGSPAAQGSPIPADDPPARAGSAAFEVGERLHFAVKLGILRVGSSTATVVGIEPIRGVDSYHFVFTLRGGIPGYRVRDRFDSWTGTEDMRTRRFQKDIHEGSYRRKDVFEIFPDSGHFLSNGADPRPTPPNPLDDTAFFYFVRTFPFEVGQTYEFSRYYREEFNPMTITVLKREKMKLPDGTEVDCLVIRPVIGSHRLAAGRTEATLWLTDDPRRLLVKMRAKLKFGTLTLKLEKIEHLTDPTQGL